MEHTIYDSKTRVTFELNGDYYLIAGEDDPKRGAYWALGAEAFGVS